MKGEFVVIKDGELKAYTNYNEIPKEFDHLIKFLPEIPPPPHSNAQHDEIHSWGEKLQNLISKENTRLKSKK
jgi:hypothetical protein